MENSALEIQRYWREVSPNDRLPLLIRDAARAFTRALQIRLAQHGVLFGHWAFLRVLWEHDGLTQKELSRRAGVMNPTTFAAVQSMEAEGYIVRMQIPTNKKNVYIHLTAKGRALRKKLLPLVDEVNTVGLTNVAPEKVAHFREVLLAIIENCAADEAQTLQPVTTSAAANGEAAPEDQA